MKTTPVPDLSNPDLTTAAKPRRALNRRGPAPLALEPRVMFDGATADAAVAAAKAAAAAVPADLPAERSVDSAQAAQDTHVPAAVVPAQAQRQEVVFIEDNVPDYQKLAAAVQPGVEVVVLDHTKDGLQQMIAALDGHAPVDAIHLVTHGANAQIDLGSNRLSLDSIDGQAAQLAALGSTLAADGDLLIYGCDAGQGDTGRAFVARMAALTGADVAASSDITGSASFGGNWVLETEAGTIDTQAIALDRAGWDGEMATTVFDANFKQLVFDGTKANPIVDDTHHTNVANGDVVRFSSVITIGTQAIDAEVTTTLAGATVSKLDSPATPDPSGASYLQPNLSMSAPGSAIFTIKFFLSGTTTAVTLQNVVVNSYDIDSNGPNNSDRQFQEFRGFSRYQIGSVTDLKPIVQSDGSVRFQYDPAGGPINNPGSTLTNDQYRVQVFYDSVSAFQVRTGAIQSGTGTFGTLAYFSLDFQLHEWNVTKVDSPAPTLSYGLVPPAETTANNGAVGSTTISLSGTNAGGTPATFAGTNGQVLDVSFTNLPAGLSAQVIRASDTTATLVFTGNALAHENVNDVTNFGITFNNDAFTSGRADAVTGASRADLKIDFNNDNIKPVATAAPAFEYAENRSAGAGAIGTVAATDDIGVTGFRFANAGGTGGSATSADGWFAIDAGGNITLTSNGLAAGAASNDYETGANSFTYAVQARDAAGNWSDAVGVTLNLKNVDDIAPAFSAGTTASPLENQPVLYTAAATDAVDFTNGNVTYGLKAGVGDAGLLSIDAGGVVRLVSGNLDFETKRTYDFTVTARDDSGNQSERAVTVAVGDVDEVAPTVTISAAAGVIKAGGSKTLSFTFSEDVGTSFTRDDVSVDSGSIGELTRVDATRYTAVYTPADGVAATDVQVRIAAGKVTDLANNNNVAPASLTLSVDTAAPRIGGPGNADGASSQLSVPEGTTALHTFTANEGVTWSLAGGEDVDSFTITPAGALAFRSAPDYELPQDGAAEGSNTYLVQVRALDAAGNASVQDVKVTVTNVNEVPVAADDAITTAEDTAKTGTLPPATDSDHDTVTYAKASDPSHGTVSIEADGTYTYTPAANYNGADSFRYSIDDGHGGSKTYTVNVTVTPVNDAPVASGTRITAEEDTPVSGTLPVATDIEHEAVTYAKAGDPSHGTVTITPAGGYTYTPAADYNGSDSFQYTISDGHGGSNTYTVDVTVSPANDAPVAADDAITTAEDTAKTGTLPQATDMEHDAVTYAKASDPAHGTVSIEADGTYTYTPAANYNGADSFRYSIDDGHGGSKTYTVNVTVTPVNDAPVASGTRITAEEDTPVSGTLPVATDIEHAAVTYAKAGDPSHGTVTITPAGAYTYTPAADYNGSDSFQYTISDGHGGSNTYTVDVTVSPANDAPVAADDAITTAEDTAKTGRLPQATDMEHDAVTYAKASDPAHGTVSIEADGSYVYMPAANYNGADGFQYTVSDGHGGSNTYTISVDVTPLNDAPVASGTRITAEEDTPVSGTLPVATDIEHEAVTYAKAGDPSHGTVTITPAGGYTYTPAADYNGSDSFQYTISDGHGGSNTYTVDMTVNAVNDAPVAANTAITTAEDTAKSGTLPPATDVDHDAVTYTKAGDPAHGTVSIGADGSYVYMPAANYNGADSFRYTVADGKGGSNTYTVAVTIDAVNDAPVAHGGAAANGTVGEPMAPLGVPAFTDVDGPAIVYTATLANGSPLPSWLAFDPATRTFTGTPPRGSVGTHDVVVAGSDGALTATAKVTIEVGNPPVPGQPLTIGSMDKDTGVSATDFITGDGSAGRTVNGSLGAPLGRNEAVQVSFDSGATWTVATTSGTNWSAVDNGAHSGNWTIEARVTNLAAGLDGTTATREVMLDTAAPAAPTVDDITTTSPTPVLHGSADVRAGEILRVTINGATYEVAAANGVWSLDLASATPVAGTATPLTVGRNYDATATITDLAGNVRSGTNTGLVSVSPPVLAPEVPPLVQPAAPVTVAAPAPTPVAEPTPVSQATDTRVRSESAPGSLAAGDSVQLGYGVGTRAADQPVLDLRSAALSDIYTRTEGFRTVVAKAEEPALVLFQGVPDQFAESGHNLSMTVPADAFAHTQPNATVRLVAVLQDGRPLPTWVQFNSQTGQFTGDVPKGLQGELKIKLIARDLGGREATALFRINVGQQRTSQQDAGQRATGELRAPAGKAGLSAQLRARSTARG